ncbi:DUF4360 domain-containing protein [Actinomadura sp. 1N219]|uniref:DUF4360 domain-containing protein n=1 Tax=Actinomadura sp. 1N219 TaxID=3375152 RepID=UPI0037B954DF
MRKGSAISALGAAALAVLAAVSPAAASAPGPVPGPDPIWIEIVAMNGPGCLPGTAKAVLSDDVDAFTITYADFTARAGGASAPADARKICALSLKMNVSLRFTYAISRTDYRLGADLQRGAKATQKAGRYFHGSSWPYVTTFDLAGPRDGEFQVTDLVPEDQLVWKPCHVERNLGITTELRVDLGTSDPSKVSSISMNADGGSRTTYHLAWKLCPERP